ncbi:MAG: hypothetical protein PHS17_17570 [Desulfobacterales bacterium]|nr:hypothetical protein [Desulfobacterales bacterium]
MEAIRRVGGDELLSIYRIEGEGIRRYIISTPETRAICNSPEVMGYPFIANLCRGLLRALRNMPQEVPFKKLKDSEVSVLHFLRGGLNFRLADLLYQAYDFKKQSSSFITSQRYRKSGLWYIKLDQYRKLTFQDNASVFLGDIVATGTTLDNGLGIILDTFKEQNIQMQNFVLLTVGCRRAEEIMSKYDALFRANFKKYHHTYVFYLEGRFGLADSESSLRVALPGTDLLRSPALLAPEFELSQYERLSNPLERCTIYDVGSRSFECLVHLEDVISYWKKLSETGMTLREAVLERWPERDYESRETLREARSGIWKNVEKSSVEALYKAHTYRWTPERLRQAEKTDSLAKFCRKRISALEKRRE